VIKVVDLSRKRTTNEAMIMFHLISLVCELGKTKDLKFVHHPRVCSCTIHKKLKQIMNSNLINIQFKCRNDVWD